MDCKYHKAALTLTFGKLVAHEWLPTVFAVSQPGFFMKEWEKLHSSENHGYIVQTRYPAQNAAALRLSFGGRICVSENDSLRMDCLLIQASWTDIPRVR